MLVHFFGLVSGLPLIGELTYRQVTFVRYTLKMIYEKQFQICVKHRENMICGIQFGIGVKLGKNMEVEIKRNTNNM